MTISIQSAKAKGRNFQKWTRDFFYELFPELQPGDIESCPMGSAGADLVMSPLAQLTVGYAVECKARKSPALYSDYDQACRHAAKAGVKLEPAVFTKGDRREPLVTISAKHFKELKRAAGQVTE
jgi:hypothetical protein